ncbi:hypothetical protein CLOSTASPAR_00083 [[Clostridium] asparagiforme DSM 15981]|uniref:Uncharacterized protein n=1 Tax=[Clostridium] asparagiforme DSM 15981 TaxID=518636 RepID=C0CSY9_9FIRM|nr:hypothetical protein CLOSTASPAR_00083 [[Clostridium] asparagiforme DSM 15981]
MGRRRSLRAIAECNGPQPAGHRGHGPGDPGRWGRIRAQILKKGRKGRWNITTISR